MFYIKSDLPVVEVSIEMIENNVVLKLNGEEVAYFDKEALMLLPDCTYNKTLPDSILDEKGYLKIVRV